MQAASTISELPWIEAPRRAYNGRMDAVERVYAFYESWRGEKRVIGRSVCGRPIVAVHAGGAGRQLLLQYAIHAREWVTCLLALEHAARGVPRGGAWFVPLSDPDGAALALRGERFLRGVSEAHRRFLLDINKNSVDFSMWKANAAAVDLNVNFDAAWGTGVRNVRVPAPENYIGPAPFSEPESRALRDFALALRPAATVSYHTKGAEIYWEFGQRGQSRARDEGIARALAAETGYRARRIEGSAGGFKDWCIHALGIPAFTIEAGSDALSHPLNEDALPALSEENAGVLRVLSELLT